MFLVRSILLFYAAVVVAALVVFAPEALAAIALVLVMLAVIRLAQATKLPDRTVRGAIERLKLKGVLRVMLRRRGDRTRTLTYRVGAL